MFDEKHGRNLFLEDADFHQEKHNSQWWDDAEPLWVTAENQVHITWAIPVHISHELFLD